MRRGEAAHVGRRRMGLLFVLVVVLAVAIPAAAVATPGPGAPPTLTGDDFVNGSGLVCNNGTWSGGPYAGAFDYTEAFFRDGGGTPVAVRQLGDWWSPAPQDGGHTITCKVTAKDPSDSSTATS